MQLHRAGGAGILGDDHVEALIGQAADGGTDALVGEDAAADHMGDAHIGQDQPQIGAGQRGIRGLGHHDFPRTWRECGDDLRRLLILRQQDVVPTRLFLAQRPVRAIGAQASDTREEHRFPSAAEGLQQAGDGRDHLPVHAGVERRPGLEPRAFLGRQRDRVRAVQIGVLHIDHQQRDAPGQQQRVRRLGRALVVEGPPGGLPMRRVGHRGYSAARTAATTRAMSSCVR